MLNLRKENIEIIKGDTLIFYIEVVDADTDICSDLSDWTGTMTIKEKIADTNNDAKITVNKYTDHCDSDEENGIVYFKVSAEDTNLLEEKKYFYDIQFEKVIDSEEHSYTVMIGDLIIIHQVTIT